MASTATESTILFNDVFNEDNFDIYENPADPREFPDPATRVAIPGAVGMLTDGYLHTRLSNGFTIVPKPSRIANLHYTHIGFCHMEGTNVRVFRSITDSNRNNVLLGPNQSDQFSPTLPNHIDSLSTNQRAPIIRVFPHGNTPIFKVGLIFLGVAYKVRCYYPRNWKPTIYQSKENRLGLNEAGFPQYKVIRNKQIKSKIPLLFRENPQLEEALLDKMEKYPFLWDPGVDYNYTLYGSASKLGEWKFVAPSLYNMDINVEGWIKYAL